MSKSARVYGNINIFFYAFFKHFDISIMNQMLTVRDYFMVFSEFYQIQFFHFLIILCLQFQALRELSFDSCIPYKLLITLFLAKK